MGLDMYLNRNTYVKNWDYQPVEKHIKVSVKKEGKPFEGIDCSKVKYIVEEVGYWRKANHIHAWFVNNVQGGKDECQESYVSSEDLRKLLDAVEAVLADHSKAEELLPCQGGFFFGSTDYDEYYFEDLKLTKKIIVPLIEEEYSGDIYYRSSW